MSDSPQPPERPENRWLPGGGDMGARTRGFDWSTTPVGPISGWSQSLRTAVRIMLDSRYAMWLGWGPAFTFFYNDAYARMTLGPKHPWALGRPAQEVWPEIWPDIGPRAESVVATGQATWDEGLLLFLERNGFPEETYHTFSYSPLPDDQGGIGGMLCVVTEDTERTIGERRLRTLRDLAGPAHEARSVEDACLGVARILAENPHDVPFALLYLLDPDGRRATLAGAAGVEAPNLGQRSVLDVRDAAGPWPLDAVLESGRAVVVHPLAGRFHVAFGGPWPEPPHQAVVLPLAQPGQAQPAGFLVAGASSRRPLDDGYRGFLDLLAGQVANTVANARAYENERRRAEELAELDRAKTAFFSNVSHEFRTPLTLMLGPVDELLATNHGTLPADAAAQLETVSRNGLRLLKLVNTLLDFSRIEAGRTRARFQPTDVAAFTADLAANFRSACERAGLGLVVTVAPLPEPVFVDRGMWEKIVFNLLSNAFKFTFDGGIGVEVATSGTDIRLTISDSGTGIPAEEMPRLFERFHRVENARGRSHEGSGIGLALVQELVRLHGGVIRAESRPGHGTTMTVTIPTGSAHLPPDQVDGTEEPAGPATQAPSFVAEAMRWLPENDEPPIDGAADSAPETGAAADRPRIIVADDNADMRQYIARILSDTYRLEFAADGQAALAAARREPPDLILSDVMMPRLDGFGLIRALHEDRATQVVPVILLSARAGEESRVDGMEAGADDYLVKPFSARELKASVGAHIQIHRLRKEAESTLRASEEQLKDANRRKDEFLATLAHELRNPLAPLRNGLEIMKLADRDAAALEQARGMMERQLGQLVHLVDDLLDLSRITSGKIALRWEVIELGRVIQQALETSRALFDAGGHDLVVRLPDDPIILEGDATRLAQVVANILNNAAKYTDRGGRVTLEAHREGSDAVLTVTDTGVGIPAAMLPRVFDIFTQVDQSLERSQGGLGIGLSLVKGIVELHGGSVEARSEGLGKGSEFRVRLPALTVRDGQRRSTEVEGTRPARTGRRILVVDDNRDSATSLASLLGLLGNEVITAYDGLEALDQAATFLPDVILLDIGMPRLNGYDTARRLRERQGDRHLVLVAMTGWGQEEDRRRSMDSGFDAHLVKPVDLDALQRLLSDTPVSTR